jgi:hypothetical protein
MTAFENTLTDAVVTVARADERRWAEFRHEQSRITHHETDYAAELALRHWFDPSRKGLVRKIDSWVQQFILDVCTEAAHGRCRVTGLVGLKEIEVPPAIFTSHRMITALFVDGEGFCDNELKLPDRTLVLGVRVSWADQEQCKGKPCEGEQATVTGPSKKHLQALYDERVTNDHVPTIKEDRQFAKNQGLTRRRARELRRANPDPRLHTTGPRPKHKP